jgi:hypothetical protein
MCDETLPTFIKKKHLKKGEKKIQGANAFVATLTLGS